MKNFYIFGIEKSASCTNITYVNCYYIFQFHFSLSVRIILLDPLCSIYLHTSAHFLSMRRNLDFYGCHSDKWFWRLQPISSSERRQAVPTLGGFRYQTVERLRRRMSLVSSLIFSFRRQPFLLLLPFPNRQLSSPITVSLKHATVAQWAFLLFY